MTDTDESQASVSDCPDEEPIICSHQKGAYDVIHVCETSSQTESSCSRQNNAASEELSDELDGVCESAASAEVFVDSSDSEINVPAASGSKSHPKCSVTLSKQQKRSQPSRQGAESAAGVPDNESSDSSLSPPSPVKPSETPKKQKSKYDLKAIFDYHFRRKKCKPPERPKYKRGGWQGRRNNVSKHVRTGRPPLTASPEERKRRRHARGVQFPFVEKHYGKKHIPLKMVLGYEKAAVKGYLQYVEKLKYEEHLKKALKALEASEDLERECLAVRKHKYLDDEGPISPIEETDDDEYSLNSDNQEDFDARVVDNSSFIISSKIPSKKTPKPKRKRAKSAKVTDVEEEEEEDCC